MPKKTLTADAVSIYSISHLKLGFGVPYFNTFFLKEPLWKKSLDFFLPGYLKAKSKGVKGGLLGSSGFIGFRSGALILDEMP